MASGRTHRIHQHITRSQIVRLASTISADNMASIAEGYMDIDDATIKNLQYENKDNAEAFNREIIRRWTYRNSENQIKVDIQLFKHLFTKSVQAKRMSLKFKGIVFDC